VCFEIVACAAEFDMRTGEKEADVSDKRVVSQSGEQVEKVIRKVVVTYRLADDPKGEDRTFTLEHEGEGEIVDALVWSAPLMKKLGYLEAEGRCTPVPTEPGKGWVVRMSSAPGDCFWFHTHSCIWEEICSPT
jgi:hypothetical protein